MARKKVIEKDRILDAVEQVLLETGGLRLTLDDLAERAGISKGGLIYTFPTKESLIAAALAREMERFLAAAAKAAPDGSFYAGLLGYAEEALRREGERSLRKAATLLTALLHAPELLAPARAGYGRLLERLDCSTEARRRARLAVMAVEAVFWLRGTGVAAAPEEVWRSILQDAHDAIQTAYLEDKEADESI